jgi:hypothetical protein
MNHLKVVRRMPHGVLVQVPDSCRHLCPQENMTFADLNAASRFFSKVVRRAKRDEKNALHNWQRIKVNADGNPRHYTSKTRLESSPDTYKTWCKK